jgi:hypothetical protein
LNNLKASDEAEPFDVDSIIKKVMGPNQKERIVRTKKYPRNTNTKKITLECQKKEDSKNIIKCKPFSS